jgi:hypothetical protein
VRLTSLLSACCACNSVLDLLRHAGIQFNVSWRDFLST